MGCISRHRGRARRVRRLALPRLRAGGGARLVVSAALGVGVAAVPAYWLRAAREAPPIHDISTDLEDPPDFIAVLPRRGDRANPVEHAGAAVAVAQRRAYPDIHSLTLGIAPAEAFALALRAAREMGWDIVAQDVGNRRIEATATTFWFGFKDDVVVRVLPSAAGSRIDVRSLSRVGVGDAGANAKRIRVLRAARRLRHRSRAGRPLGSRPGTSPARRTGSCRRIPSPLAGVALRA